MIPVPWASHLDTVAIGERRDLRTARSIDDRTETGAENLDHARAPAMPASSAAATAAGSSARDSVEPMPRATAPAAIHSGAVATVMPPVGTAGRLGIAASRSRNAAGDHRLAGKILTKSAPQAEGPHGFSRGQHTRR